MALILTAVGAILWMVGAVEVYHGEQPRQFTMGTVVATSVEVRRYPLARDAFKRTAWVPVVEYAYEVDGTPYRNDVMWAGLAADEESYIPEGAEAIVASYPVGSQVPVYYVAEDPQDSVLNYTQTPGWILVAMGGAFFVGAAVVIVRSRAAERAERRPR